MNLAELPDDAREGINRCLRQGQLLAAVKIYREHADCSLAEARDAVKQMERELRSSGEADLPPGDDDPVVKTSSGCFNCGPFRVALPPCGAA